MTGRSQYDEALYRVEASDWQRQEAGGDPMQEAAVAQVHATLAVVDELKRMNDRGDRFNAAMLDLFERLADPFEAPPEGPSGAGATAQPFEPEYDTCPTCGRTDVLDGRCPADVEASQQEGEDR